MAEKPHSGDLELDQDLAFERRTWTVERVAWVAMGLMGIAALAGLLGPGPLSKPPIGEATKQALLGENFSLTNAFLIILTLIGLDIAISLWQQRWPRLGKWIEGCHW
jgi:hypothetical protein